MIHQSVFLEFHILKIIRISLLQIILKIIRGSTFLCDPAPSGGAVIENLGV